MRITAPIPIPFGSLAINMMKKTSMLFSLWLNKSTLNAYPTCVAAGRKAFFVTDESLLYNNLEIMDFVQNVLSLAPRL